MEESQLKTTVGKSPSRIDGEAKVTGKAIYTVDITLPGMAYGRILRSPYPHARSLNIDARKAKKSHGVVAVLTREDLGEFGCSYGATYKDQSIVATEKVRYVGDPIAAVAATDEAAANHCKNTADLG